MCESSDSANNSNFVETVAFSGSYTGDLSLKGQTHAVKYIVTHCKPMKNSFVQKTSLFGWYRHIFHPISLSFEVVAVRQKTVCDVIYHRTARGGGGGGGGNGGGVLRGRGGYTQACLVTMSCK